MDEIRSASVEKMDIALFMFLYFFLILKIYAYRRGVI